MNQTVILETSSIETISTFVLAGATFLLAFVALSALFVARNQFKVVRERFKIERSRIVPYLSVTNLSFITADTLCCNIENVSDATAHWIGLSSYFYIVAPQYYDSLSTGNTLTYSEVKQRADEGKESYIKFYMPPNSIGHLLIYKDEEVSPKRIVNFAESGLTEAILPPHSGIVAVQFRPKFYVQTPDGHFGQFFNYDEFRDFLVQNNIEYVAVHFNLIYKDVAETALGGNYVDAFAIDVNKHKTLREAWKTHFPLDFLALSSSQIISNNRLLTEDLYRNMSSSWNLPTW